MSLAGYLPQDLGLVDLNPTEMMFWMYLPISVPGSDIYRLPDNVRPFGEIVTRVKENEPERFRDSYVYLTAKTLWVGGDYIGNRPGWHIDGYGSDDVNYLWYDRAPTEFMATPEPTNIDDDCDRSIAQMTLLAACRHLVTFHKFPDRHLLRLDNTVIHRSPDRFYPGVRTFVKVSLSSDRYNLIGNSRNYLLPETLWPLIERESARNHPARPE